MKSSPSTRLMRCVSFIVCFAIGAIVPEEVAGQSSIEFHGQASAWATPHFSDAPWVELGARYIPDLVGRTPIGDGLEANGELALRLFGSGMLYRGAIPTYDGAVKPYRLWGRVGSDQCEVRIGLQKITFGSALMFRPLMWFDKVDPRDPLQMTDGVYALLARWYFRNNANLWLWGLYGNSDPVGWEPAPTSRHTGEAGARGQVPFGPGEFGVSIHYRRADESALSAAGVSLPGSVPEYRLGIDGKWDVGIGLWCEAAVIRQEIDAPPFAYQRQGTIGADYTIGVGNGVYVAAEYFRTDNPGTLFGSATGRALAGLTMNYPVGLLDQVSLSVYRDWSGGDWYRIASVQRKYDDWAVYALAFWNPSTIVALPGGGASNAFAGSGIQMLVVYNH